MSDANPARDFDVKTSRTLRATPGELTALVLDPALLAQWSGKVFMHCEVVEQGDAEGRGMRLKIFSKGWMPHSFLFDICISDLEPDRWMIIDAKGDFEGQARVDVTAISPEEVRGDIHWRTDINHPQLRFLVRLLRPVLTLNHKWAVAKIARMAEAEIARRRRGANTTHAPAPTFGIWMRFLGKSMSRRARAKGWSKFDQRE